MKLSYPKGSEYFLVKVSTCVINIKNPCTLAVMVKVVGKRNT